MGLNVSLCHFRLNLLVEITFRLVLSPLMISFLTFFLFKQNMRLIGYILHSLLPRGKKAFGSCYTLLIGSYSV